MAQLQCYDTCPDAPAPTQLALMPCYQCPPATEPAVEPEEPEVDPTP